MLISFVLLGKFLEALARKETSSALAALMKLAANSARLVNLNSNVDSSKSEFVNDDIIGTQDIDLVMLQRGDIVKVLPGDTLPADGVVVKGSSTVNESC